MTKKRRWNQTTVGLSLLLTVALVATPTLAQAERDRDELIEPAIETPLDALDKLPAAASCAEGPVPGLVLGIPKCRTAAVALSSGDSDECRECHRACMAEWRECRRNCAGSNPEEWNPCHEACADDLVWCQGTGCSGACDSSSGSSRSTS